ncbi:c-type cytochrome [Aquilutibacter rugosus]
MKRPLTILAIAGLAFAAAGAMSAEPAPAKTAAATSATAPATAAAPSSSLGNAQRGKELAYTCRGCHGVAGFKNAYPNYHVPRIGGQSEAYLRSALMEYRKGTRKHPTMRAQATSYSEQQLADIAAYLASVKP